jgi:hypothetical protein
VSVADVLGELAVRRHRDPALAFLSVVGPSISAADVSALQEPVKGPSGG